MTRQRPGSEGLQTPKRSVLLIEAPNARPDAFRQVGESLASRYFSGLSLLGVFPTPRLYYCFGMRVSENSAVLLPSSLLPIG